MNKGNIKKKIEEYELYRNGLSMISGAYVKAVNLRLSRNTATCDIKLVDVDRIERYNNCEYNLKALGWL
jgi:hypothetical protein